VSPLYDCSCSFSSSPEVHANGATNIHVSYIGGETLQDDIVLVYGDCGLTYPDQSHHEIGRFAARNYSEKPCVFSLFLAPLIYSTRFVWLTPADISHDGCLHAFDASGLLGISSPIKVKGAPLKKRSTLSEINDPYGPWFDGVAYLQAKNQSDSFVAGKKDQKIAILGGGMAGLMSGLLLDQVGIHNWEISESSDRIGGYVT
jgi:hypothetical protein